jgi:uncharacterized protein (DUF433 family)
MPIVQRIDLVTTDPNVRSGKPCIGGTGIRVTDVAMAHLFHRRTPDEISSDYNVSLAQVHAALAYYFGHKAELDEDIRRQIIEAKKLKEEGLARGSSLLSG